MIFLGAGASKAFGIKTLQEMSQDLEEFMEKRGHKELIVSIKEKLGKYQLNTDFESLYSIVEGLANPKDSIIKAGAFTAFICKESIDVMDNRESNALLNDFRNFIIEACEPQLEKSQEILSAFTRLFSVLDYDRRHDMRFTHNGLVGKYVSHSQTIVTTNYDMIPEQYFWNINLKFIDGFKDTNNPYRRDFDLSTYDNNPDGIWLIKLHGSTWMYRNKYGSVFKTTNHPKKCLTPMDAESEMMIFPMKEKPILENPYYDFYSIFRMQAWTKLVVIGYSFRDEPVNIAILSNLKKIDKSVLVVIDPRPEEAIQNLSPSLPKEVSDRIICIKGLFGKDEVFDHLSLTKQVETKERFQQLISRKNSQL